LSSHLRLAERQGLLTGRFLSLPQTAALVILNHIDEIGKAQAERTALKRALIARKEFSIERMFPDYFPAQSEKEPAPDSNGIAPDDFQHVTWKSPKDDMKEWERLSRLLGNNKGTLSGDEVVSSENKPEPTWTEWR